MDDGVWRAPPFTVVAKQVLIMPLQSAMQSMQSKPTFILYACLQSECVCSDSALIKRIASTCATTLVASLLTMTWLQPRSNPGSATIIQDITR